MPLLIVEGKKYRIGNITDDDPFWSVLVDEKTIGLEVLGQSSAQPATLFVRARSSVIGVSVQRQEGQRVYFVGLTGGHSPSIFKRTQRLAILASQRFSMDRLL